MPTFPTFHCSGGEILLERTPLTKADIKGLLDDWTVERAIALVRRDYATLSRLGLQKLNLEDAIREAVRWSFAGRWLSQ